jgi:hypothetical protein
MMTLYNEKENAVPDFKRSFSISVWEFVFWFLIVCGIGLAIWQYFVMYREGTGG